MEILLINFKYNLSDLRKHFYDNGKRNSFSYLRTKNLHLIFLGLIIFYTFFYISSFYYPAISWVLFLIGIGLVFLLVKTVLHIYSYLEWKKSVEVYIKKLANYKICKIVLSENAIEFINNDETIIEKWENFNRATILNDHIKLEINAGNYYLFFANSITESEYKQFKTIIKNKLIC